MNVAVYYRLSTKAQGESDRYGLPRQKADVAAYVQREGHTVVATFEDIGFSGASANRPGLASLLEAEGFDAVVVPCWDRLARDTTLDGFLRYSLEKRGVALLSATQENGVDPIARLTQSILAAVAGYERHLITQRLAGARKVKAAKGGYAHGAPPYGYRAENASLVEIAEEQAVIAMMRSMRARGSMLKDIVARLNARKVATRNGNEWQLSTVAAILKRAA